MVKRSRNESKPPGEPDSPSGSPHKKVHRTPRACDRCRLKKLKCDGQCFCSQCSRSDSACLYSHRSNSTNENYHSQMLGIMNEALRRMYTACRRGTGFPGEMPQQVEIEAAEIPIHVILHGLGLISIIETDLPLTDGHDGKHFEHTRRASDGSKSISTVSTETTMHSFVAPSDTNAVLDSGDHEIDLFHRHEQVFGAPEYFQVGGGPYLLQSLSEFDVFPRVGVHSWN